MSISDVGVVEPEVIPSAIVSQRACEARMCRLGLQYALRGICFDRIRSQVCQGPTACGLRERQPAECRGLSLSAGQQKGQRLAACTVGNDFRRTAARSGKVELALPVV